MVQGGQYTHTAKDMRLESLPVERRSVVLGVYEADREDKHHTRQTHAYEDKASKNGGRRLQHTLSFQDVR